MPTIRIQVEVVVVYINTTETQQAPFESTAFLDDGFLGDPDEFQSSSVTTYPDPRDDDSGAGTTVQIHGQSDLGKLAYARFYQEKPFYGGLYLRLAAVQEIPFVTPRGGRLLPQYRRPWS